MKLLPLPEGGLRLHLEVDEAAMLDQLVAQLMQLLQSHSGTALDPDPLFASLEVGGSDDVPEDPALARLFPNAYEDDADATQFRRVTEQGLLNRKLQDAIQVTTALGLGGGLPSEDAVIEVDISTTTLPAWARTVTALRLAIAARIGLDTAEDHDRLLEDEETRGTVLVFDWLAAILEAALMMQGGALLDGDDGDDADGSADDASDRA
ncbi:DUF2017 domain-containing protein [Leucobacter rhizosphaerae]|uniref:DUF2017 domain-containing protein n=1 Tax=Leucobacter rhizosphaerae TaxID=2932245 RepID=A0ABY4FX37_9MICO|nr:DUF2017 family protein [Leucobacter rhizosphaerae]UOQ60689.1 DUF2017 domain-containing protein [Leucobacter rhizosphaerae]